jgi:hypothetical protein
MLKIRAILKAESGDATSLTTQIRALDLFKKGVLDSLADWELKATSISNLSLKYRVELDE